VAGRLLKKTLDPFSMEDIEKWLGVLPNYIPDTQQRSVTMNIASVAANSYSSQTVAVKGLKTTNTTEVQILGLTTDLHYINHFVSAADTLTILFYNDTAGAIVEGNTNIRVTFTATA